MRTKTGAVGAVYKPFESATCSSPVCGSWKTVILKSPKAVGNCDVATNSIGTATSITCS